ATTPTEVSPSMGVTSYVQPPRANQPTGTMGTADSRMLNAAWRNNVLVSTQTVGTGATVTAHARWYQFDTSSTPSLTQSGEINPGAGIATYFPSIDIDVMGDLGMTYMESSTSEFVSMYVTGRTPGDPAGTMETKVKGVGGTASNTANRTGNWSGTCVDPTNGTTFWSANQFFTSTDAYNWSTGIASFAIIPPAVVTWDGGGADSNWSTAAN